MSSIVEDLVNEITSNSLHKNEDVFQDKDVFIERKSILQQNIKTFGDAIIESIYQNVSEEDKKTWQNISCPIKTINESLQPYII